MKSTENQHSHQNTLNNLNDFLKSFNCVEDGNVKIRFIHTTKKVNGSYLAINAVYDYPLTEIPYKENCNTYFVVNGQGIKAKDIKHGRALWIEYDNISKEEQLIIWKHLGFPTPTYQVDTGGKSIHTYWILNENVDIEIWHNLQKRLLLFAEADQSVGNKAQIMRLPECNYYQKETGEVKGKTKILTSTGKTYSVEVFESILPELPKRENEPVKPQITFNSGNCDNASDEKLILDCLECIKPRTPGTKTYEHYRANACGIKTTLGHDRALQILNAHSPNETNWEHFIDNNYDQYNLGTVIFYASGGENGIIGGGFDIKKWLKENRPYSQEQKREYAKSQYSGKGFSNKEVNQSEKSTDKEVSKEEFERLEKEKFKQVKLERLESFKKFMCDIKIHTRFICDELKKIDLKGKILAIKSAKNTGKSYWLADLMNDPQYGFILVGNRRVLTRVNCNNMGLLFTEDIDKSECEEIVIFNQIRNSGYRHKYPNLRGLGVVLDSLLKLRETDYDGKVIVFDEANQIVDSLLLSSTYVVLVRGLVIRLLSDIVSKAKAVILADGDLSDHTVNFFHELSNKNLSCLKVENTYQENNRKLLFYPDRDSISEEIMNYLNEGKNIVIASDSARELTAIDELLKGYNKVLITKDELEHSAVVEEGYLYSYLNNYGSLIKEQQIQVLQISPSVQSGVSFEIGDHFDAVFYLGYAVIPVDIARQMLVRERSNCDRHAWVSERGKHESNYDPQEILKTENFKRDYVMNGLQFFADPQDDFDQMVAKASKAIAEGKDNIRKLAEKTTAELIAKHNIEKSMYRDIFLKEVKEEGYDVIELENENQIESSFRKAIGEKKTDNKWKEANQTLEAPDISFGEAVELSNKPALSKGDRLKLKKYNIEVALPNFELTPEFIFSAIIEDRWKTINGIRNYYLANNPEIAEILDHNQFFAQINKTRDDGDGIFWQFDLKAKKALSDIFSTLELQKLIDENEILTSDRIKSLVKRFNWHRDKLRIFNIKFNNKSDYTKILRKILNLFGFTLSSGNKSNGEKKYIVTKMLPSYKINGLGDQVLDCWDDIYSSLKTYYLEISKNKIPEFLATVLTFDQKPTQTIVSKDLGHRDVSQDEFRSNPQASLSSKPDTVRGEGHFEAKVSTNVQGKNKNEDLDEQKIKQKTNFEYLWNKKVRVIGTNLIGIVKKIYPFNSVDLEITKSNGLTEIYPVHPEELELDQLEAVKLIVEGKLPSHYLDRYEGRYIVDGKLSYPTN